MARMSTDTDFNREWTLIHANRLRKTLLAVVTIRKALPQCFPDRNPTAYTALAVAAQQHSFSAACYIREHPRNPREKLISACKWPSVVQGPVRIRA
jgi:hypothetical protein